MKYTWFKISIIFLILISAIPVVVLAQVHKYELNNGLKLLVKEDHRAPVVVTQIWYKVGSSYENDGITGISHVLEHMMFKGTEKYPPGEFSRIISENGGRDNAFTGPDYTSYFQTLEKSRLSISFELEADRMRHLKLSDEEFIKEIEVVKEERRWRTEDNPQSFLYEAVKAAAFQTSSYRSPVIGWMQDLDNMTINDLKEWYKTWYAPNNATVVVVGDVDPNDVYALAYEYFGPLSPEESITTKKQIEVPQLGTKRITVKRPAELPTIIMAFKTPVIKPNNQDDNEYDWEPYALEVLAGILDGGNSARISSRLVRGNEVAAAASASYQMASRLDNLFTLSGTPAPDKSIQELEVAFRNEILNLQTYPVSDEELQRVKAQVISSDVYEKDSIFYQAMIIGILETVGLSWDLADKYVERIKAVTNEQVLSVAKKYLIDDRLTIADLYPLPIQDNSINERKTKDGNAHAH
ncbi:MAG: pitrilysin family protein [Pseudomonadota bacterium]|nr:pitrilysin family protein [Pseudomonadota bacterium]|tara:strand:+ start:407 stop:1807 length:1401 start_codon:yes stop_codon:yes gene_type:complete